uniref:Uncharacterized protein n=1 Tax=Manihot esculenta TaxID=3983 RepID=A0A2C9VZA7_MANES
MKNIFSKFTFYTITIDYLAIGVSIEDCALLDSVCLADLNLPFFTTHKLYLQLLYFNL